MQKCRNLLLLLIVALIFGSCGKAPALPQNPAEIEGLVFKERVETDYADKFTIDRYEGGYSLISVADGGRYLIVPENADAPEVDGNIKLIRRPAENIYLAATAAMSMFDELGRGSAVRFSGTKAEDWYIEYAKNALESGDMLYAGKYREPDYELLLGEGCELSIQSTMIDHAPEVREKLEELGITVFVDYSSYESHPLGRSEWIKVYGELLGESDEADRLFDEQAAHLETAGEYEGEKKTVVFFYISDSGRIVTRKSGDYITKMIELAGGENVFSDLWGDSASGTVTMEPEEFYTRAKDADVIIYNSTVGGELSTIDELLAKNALLADFRAVKSGEVWCTKNNLYQETMKLGAVISDFHAVLTGDGDTRFLYRLKGGGDHE